MKPAKFKYWDPTSVEQVVEFLGEHGDEAKVLAGGQSLVPMMSMRLARPGCLVDINGVAELDYVREENGCLALGALVRQDSLLSSETVARRCPLLHRAIPYIGHTAIRYRGTVGGSVAHSDPAAELPAVLTALDGEVVLRGAKGTRTVAAGDLFRTYFTTTIDTDELLTEVRLPARPPGGSAVVELARRHGDFALVGVAASVAAEAGRIGSARICAFGVADVPRRLEDAERLVAGQEPAPELLDEAAEQASRAVDPESDIHASGDYRRAMTGVVTRRALRQALEEAAVSL